MVLLALALAAVVQPPATGTLVLELRIFDGGEEVTAHTRVAVHRAGERDSPVAQLRGAGGLELKVPEGIYDVQAIHERDGRVLNIRWANRLVVMPYPDEAGRHLEVVNFRSGFGALQVRTQDESPLDVSLHTAGTRNKPVAAPVSGPSYTLFVVPAGVYDLRVETDGKQVLHRDLEVPVDRTRLWLQP